MTNPMRSRTRAFTLIELLVVISIISLLMALLMPALSKARQATRQVQCQSQSRQIFLAMMSYVDANRGYMPQRMWYFHNAPNTHGPQVRHVAQIGQKAWMALLTCPDVEYAGATVFGGSGAYTAGTFGYNPHWWTANATSSEVSTPTITYQQLARAIKPSGALVHFDAQNSTPYNTNYMGDFERPRHGGIVSGFYNVFNIGRKANFTYADGHVWMMTSTAVSPDPYWDGPGGNVLALDLWRKNIKGF